MASICRRAWKTRRSAFSSSSARPRKGRRSCSASPTAPAKVCTIGASCCSISNVAGSPSRRILRSPTGRSASGRRSARSGRKPASSYAGSTRRQTCWPGCRRASIRKPSARCRTSRWPKPKPRPGPPSMLSSKATPSSTTRPPNVCARIARRCWHSMTFPPSIGSACERPTRSRARSRPFATEPSDPKGASRTGQPSPWCSSWSRRPEDVAPPRWPRSLAKAHPRGQICRRVGCHRQREQTSGRIQRRLTDQAVTRFRR